MKNIIGIIILFFLLLLYIMPHIMNNIVKKTNQLAQTKQTSFRKINKKLDKEHNDIFKAIDKLYELCEKHWNTEEKMYKDGRKKMPKSHDNVTKIWKSHNNEHKIMLKQIADMKKNIIKHIQEQDAQHFHWT